MGPGVAAGLQSTHNYCRLVYPWSHAFVHVHGAWPCSDDVDDQYTEKGRQLIRKEGEALAAGMRMGEILAAGDLELPGVVPRKKQGALTGSGPADEMNLPSPTYI
jgi:hypothetical protein